LEGETRKKTAQNGKAGWQKTRVQNPNNDKGGGGAIPKTNPPWDREKRVKGRHQQRKKKPPEAGRTARMKGTTSGFDKTTKHNKG